VCVCVCVCVCEAVEVAVVMDDEGEGWEGRVVRGPTGKGCLAHVAAVASVAAG